MLYLVMQLDKMIVDKWLLLYENLTTAGEKKFYQERMAQDMLLAHQKLINQVQYTKPIFYVVEQSKLNDFTEEQIEEL